MLLKQQFLPQGSVSVACAYVCVHAHARGCMPMTCCIDIHLFNLPPWVRTVCRKVKTPLSQAYDFFPLFSGRFRSGFYRLFHLSDLCPLSRLLHGPSLQQPHGCPTRLNEVSYQ